MRLIAADALMEIAEQQGHLTIDDILNAPTIDAVPVVRCGECKYFHNRTCKIRKGSWGEQLKVGYTDYCSDGERKDGEG